MSKKKALEPKKVKLTAKQRKLVDEYLIIQNITKAAIAAGYSKKTASVLGSETFKKPYVQEYYRSRIADITAKNDDKVSWVLSRLIETANADIRDFVDKNGIIKKLDKTVNGRLIQSIRHTREGVNIQLQSQDKALELLGKYLSMWSDKVDVSVSGTQDVNIVFNEVSKTDA
jgi:phage terminase small subunit